MFNIQLHGYIVLLKIFKFTSILKLEFISNCIVSYVQYLAR